jgi:hypothetical protein
LTWPPSKVSKLENGRQTPTDDDIRAWTRVTGGDGETEALLASLHTLEVQHAEWQNILKSGLQVHQAEIAEQDQKTRLYRIFESAVVPGLLQTPEYARTCFSQAVTMYKISNDVNDAVRARMRRQEMLYREDRRFHVVLTEAALRYRLCTPEIMLGQLDRLISLSTLRNLKLGIIDSTTQYVVDARHGFWIHDSELVVMETYSAELNLRQPREIELYGRIFEQLAAVASYGSSARAIITRVLSDLAQDLPDDGD